MLYAEGGRHVYGGAASPDGRYLLFTRSIVIIGVAPRWRPLPRPEPEMMGLQRIACELPDLFPRIVLQHGAELPLVFATTAKLKLDGAPERVVFSSA